MTAVKRSDSLLGVYRDSSSLQYMVLGEFVGIFTFF